MPEYFAVLDKATGALRWSGQGVASEQVLSDNLVAITVDALIQDVVNYDTTLLIAPTKAMLSAAVYAKRDALISGGCPLDGVGVMPTDIANKTKILGAVLMALCSKSGMGTFKPIEWTLVDGSKTTFDADQTISMGFTVGQREQACHKQEQDLNAAIAAATTIPAVLAVDITSGWPA